MLAISTETEAFLDTAEADLAAERALDVRRKSPLADVPPKAAPSDGAPSLSAGGTACALGAALLAELAVLVGASLTATREAAALAHEAAALLVVLGAALLMQVGGLSMAMGAFLAGVLLSESTFRHQLEADIEPFRGLLLGLFFLSVGMSLDLAAVASNWPLTLT